MDSDKYFHAKKLQFFISKERTVCGRRLSISATFQKQIYPGKNFHTKNSVFEMKILFSNKRNKVYVEEAYHFLPPFKKCIPSKTSMPKSFSV